MEYYKKGRMGYENRRAKEGRKGFGLDAEAG
jgi:hypothetical protein